MAAAPEHGTECRDIRGDGRVGRGEAPSARRPILIPSRRQRVKKSVPKTGFYGERAGSLAVREMSRFPPGKAAR